MIKYEITDNITTVFRFSHKPKQTDDVWKIYTKGNVPEKNIIVLRTDG